MAELEAAMTVRELAEWEAYARIQPFGPWIDDLRVARICAEVANASQNVNWKKRGNKFFTPADFLPSYAKPRPRPQTPAQLKAALKDYFQAHNERVIAAQQQKPGRRKDGKK